MKLILHIGIHKTGSSILQTLMEINKPLLLKQGVFVPNSKWDVKMKRGEISPGNGHKLAVLISNNSLKELIAYLEMVFSNSERARCDNVLLSNEVLVRLFSDSRRVEKLIKSAKLVGFSSVKFICFWREPISHAESLFKHRSKSVTFDSYEKWLESDYETWGLAERFLDNMKKFPEVSLSNYLYQRLDGYLETVFFRESLSIVGNLLQPTKLVNPSLGFNEIAIMQFYENKYPNIRSSLYPILVENMSYWVQNKYLQIRFRVAAKQYFLKQRGIIDKVANLLQTSDKTVFLTKIHEPEIHSWDENMSFVFLKRHEAVISNLLDNYTCIWLKDQIWSTMLYLYNRVRQKIVKNNYNSKKFGGNLPI